MQYNPQKHHRKSIRLKGYDYSQQGLYFITICTQNRECLFGDIINGKMILNEAGKMVENEWLKLPERFINIELHEYTVMPNHFHAILKIVGVVVHDKTAVPNNDRHGRGNPCGYPIKGQPQGIAPTGIDPTGKIVGDMVGAFESITTVEYIRGVKQYNWPRFDGKLWQRNYWEHIIRNQNEYQFITQYIVDNPEKWKNDKLNHTGDLSK